MSIFVSSKKVFRKNMIKAVLLISSFLSLIAPSEPSFEVLVTAEQNNEIVDQNGSF